MNYYGSLCLSDIPARLIKEGKDGKKYLNIHIIERKEPSQYGETHFITASCKKEDEVEGENRFIGGVQPFVPSRKFGGGHVVEVLGYVSYVLDRIYRIIIIIFFIIKK